MQVNDPPEPELQALMVKFGIKRVPVTNRECNVGPGHDTKLPMRHDSPTFRRMRADDSVFRYVARLDP